ncbi:hypothetical protein K443DRAFT_122035 [Laccaria amethystina LaAM-08-1]|uniref:DRBM domain-containing protein n=1 Tax=Laccaria amethystina LaAM-08-1 TaxID=1095629 RepID=A0A0C9WT53_9AGAR|nr:hypothetical protein K443DRAFT_122035 [Laccaria amethystina LaAM-08-1]
MKFPASLIIAVRTSPANAGNGWFIFLLLGEITSRTIRMALLKSIPGSGVKRTSRRAGFFNSKFISSSLSSSNISLLIIVNMPEYVNMLNNKGQQQKKTVKYTEKREGPEDDETWTITVFVDKIESGKGVGKNRATAKAAAAKQALEALHWI